MTATLVSLSPPCWSDEAAMLVRASRPVALRAGSAAPRRTLSDSVAEPVNSAQEYFFFGQPRADLVLARLVGDCTHGGGDVG